MQKYNLHFLGIIQEIQFISSCTSGRLLPIFNTLIEFKLYIAVAYLHLFVVIGASSYCHCAEQGNNCDYIQF